jgi:hypothetical protein
MMVGKSTIKNEGRKGVGRWRGVFIPGGNSNVTEQKATMRWVHAGCTAPGQSLKVEILEGLAGSSQSQSSRK